VTPSFVTAADGDRLLAYRLAPPTVGRLDAAGRHGG